MRFHFIPPPEEFLSISILTLRIEIQIVCFSWSYRSGPPEGEGIDIGGMKRRGQWKAPPPCNDVAGLLFQRPSRGRPPGPMVGPLFGHEVRLSERAAVSGGVIFLTPSLGFHPPETIHLRTLRVKRHDARESYAWRVVFRNETAPALMRTRRLNAR